MNTRYAFLDVYRGIIVLLMIEGHAVREFLQPALQTSPAFRLHELLHGITGPGFLFGAGITFGISAERRWSEFLQVTPTLVRRMRKIGLLILTGYALHLPFFSLQKTITATSPEGWKVFLGFDVLQCIGFGLLILQVLLILLRRRRLFLGVVAVIGTALLVSAPIVWRWELHDLPMAITMALQGTWGSVYPLVPYAAFLFAGAIGSYEFTKHAEAGTEAVFIRRLAVAGALCILTGFALEWVPLQIYSDVDFWHDSPNFLLMKLGGLFLLMSGAWVLETRGKNGILQPLAILGIESLFVYVLHLVVLYGSPINASAHLSSLWGGTFGWLSAGGAAVGFTLALYGTAWIWRGLKIHHPVLFRTVQIWLAVVLSYEFLTSPY